MNEFSMMTPEYSLVEKGFQFRNNGFDGLVEQIFADRRGLLGSRRQNSQVSSERAEFGGAGDSQRHTLFVVADP